ncbi:MAG TPA: DUF3068 domain-containing protein [Jatrophihabitans sp.]|nr:DUF3068 domain-containing protein [Jatrophihabitans sp.]
MSVPQPPSADSGPQGDGARPDGAAPAPSQTSKSRARGWPLYVLVFLGVFLLVLAGAVKFIIAPRVVKAPLTIPQKYTLVLASGHNFSYFDAAAGKNIKINVWITRTVVGDPIAGNNDVAVYNESLCLTRDDGTHPGCVSRTAAPGVLITNSTDRVAFNRITGLAVNDPKYGANVDGSTAVTHVGLGYKFPIDTQKTTYPFFDTTVHRAFPMRYAGETTMQGLTVYKFVQKIVNQPALTNATLPSTYSNTRTVWVEPTTGVIVDGQEQVKQVLTGRANLDPNSKLVAPELANLVALAGTLAFTPDTVRLQAELAKSNLPRIHLIRLWMPLIALVLGVLCLAAALWIALRRRNRPGGAGETAGPGPGGGAGPAREPEPETPSEPAAAATRPISVHRMSRG